MHSLSYLVVVLKAVQRIKTVHSAGCTGASDLRDLNGPEISKFIKRECSTSALAVADAASTLTASVRASHSVLSRWLKQLLHSLLHSGDWTSGDIDAWRSAVHDIHQHWCAETQQTAFPKLHMLHHSIDFAERHRFLGRASEAQIDSCDIQFPLPQAAPQHVFQHIRTPTSLTRRRQPSRRAAFRPAITFTSFNPSNSTATQ
jgi:hypothetical protein